MEQRGEGWYFGHGGSNWGFQADVLGHLRKGYGVAIMTNGDRGRALITEIEARVAAARPVGGVAPRLQPARALERAYRLRHIALTDRDHAQLAAAIADGTIESRSDA